MLRTAILLLMTFLASAVCWWPAIIEPSLDFPRWILLALVALMTGASILLSRRSGWLAFVAAAAAGTFVGMLTGVNLWPLSDGIAQSYALFVVLIGTGAAAGVAVISGWTAFLVGRKWPLPRGRANTALWAILGLCLAVAPALFALTKPLVKRRVARNESIAALRFSSLKNAIQETRASRSKSEGICDGQSLQKHYSGPPFSQADWSRIAGNYVEEGKYVYMISCLQPGGYLLEARPKMPRVYGYGNAHSAPASPEK